MQMGGVAVVEVVIPQAGDIIVIMVPAVAVGAAWVGQSAGRQKQDSGAHNGEEAADTFHIYPSISSIGCRPVWACRNSAGEAR